MQENMDIKIINNLKKIFRTNYENDLIAYKNLEKIIYSNPKEVTNELRTEIEMYKIKAQTGIFAYKVIEKCKTLEELKIQRKIIEKSAFEYGERYAKALQDANEGKISDRTYDMICDKIKFYLLKTFVNKIIETISLKEYSLCKLLDKDKEELNNLNENIYDLKLKLAKLPLEKVKEKNSIYEQLDNLIEKRKSTINKYIGIEMSDKILNELEDIENNTSENHDKVKKPSYYLTKDEYKEKLDNLNDTLRDLKINRLKSTTFYAIHINDGKHNGVALSKDILKYSQEREDIIKSVLGEDTELLYNLNEISELEGITNKRKRKSSLLSEFMVNLSFKRELKEHKKIIYEALEKEFEKKEKIEIKSYEVTYKERLKGLENAYKELPKEIEKTMVIQMGKKVKEDDERRKLMQMELTSVFDDLGTVLENPLKGMKE